MFATVARWPDRRFWLSFAALFLLVSRVFAAPASVDLVVGTPETARAVRVSASGSEEIALPAGVPLGSLWKLFVYAYLSERHLPGSDYRCTGAHPAEEAYCCAPGESIDRERALARSCGLYFSPKRLNVLPAAWAAHWQAKTAAVPPWLSDLESLAPATEVSVASILAALAAIDEPARQQSMRALRRVALEPRARPLLSHLGSSLRVKTWSWRDRKGQRIGGFAGWLADGTPVWLGGRGTSASIIADTAPWLGAHLPASAPPDDACVNVRYFSRYPLAEVALNGQAAGEGWLRGAVKVVFRNGRAMHFPAGGDLYLSRAGEVPRLEGRFGLNDYVARVIQREATTQPVQAARALGVAVRTYLARHADYAAGCYRIDDDSRAQRVSAAPASRAARAAADWSDGLVLNGVAGRYHQTQRRAQQLSWQQAVSDASAGLRWDEILEQAYGAVGLGLVGEGDAGECQPLTQAEHWLAARQPAWKRQLAGVSGFEAPLHLPRICRLAHGNPYADLGRGRIYATGVATASERLTIAHEFLHFGLINHPRGRDEAYVEQTARILLGIP